MDLAQGHIVALDALDKDATFVAAGTNAAEKKKDTFGGSGGKYRAFNLGKGKGFSVLEIVEAMRKATQFDYKYTIVGRRCVTYIFSSHYSL
jgi:UDP-glucose 4-epimerase